MQPFGPMVGSATSKTLLVIWHSRTGASEAMARAAAAHEAARLVRATDVTANALEAAAGYLFVCPENLGGLTGAMKEMFDTTYYDLLGKIEGRAYATIIAAGSDGEGAQRQLDRIVTGWRLVRVADPMIVNFNAQTPEAIWAQKRVEGNVLRECDDLGCALAEGLQMGVF
jgi:multimeric flavodoxin WrbA